MANSAKRDKAKFKTNERRAEAVRLRIAGNSVRATAALMKTSKSMVDTYLRQALDMVPREDIERLRTIDNEQVENKLRTLDVLMALRREEARTDNDAAKVYATLQGQWTNLHRYLARINGLEAPQKVEHTGPAGGPLQMDLTKLSDDELQRIVLTGVIALPGESGTGDPPS